MHDRVDTVEKPVKICFIGLKAYPIFNTAEGTYFGGAEVDLYYLAKELAKDEKFKVSYIVADYGQGRSELYDGVEVIRSLDFSENLVISVFKFYKAMRQADADIYFYKTITIGIALIALFCIIHRKKFVYRTAHTDHCDGTYLKKYFFMGKIYKWALKTAKIVSVQNETDKICLKKTTGVDSVPIPNGHILSELTATKRDSILWVGRDAEFKRPHEFLRLAQQFPEEHFVMVCQTLVGDTRYKDLVERAESIRNLDFIKHVPFDEIDNYFKQAKVFVNTSDAEGFPNTFIQACKSATPILSFNVNPDDFLNAYSCGLCCEGELNELANSLAFMLEENRYQRMGSNARKYAQEHHDITKIVEQYKKLFVEVKERAKNSGTV